MRARADTQRTLNKIYRDMYRALGPQRWWPGETPFEVMVGAILTQNTAWTNVERAIANLKREGLLSVRQLGRTSLKRLARLIRPAGYFNVKAERLSHFLKFLETQFQNRIERMRQVPLARLREKLLSVKGIGKETADSILLYALDKPIFVVDAYTRRILSRHRLVRPDAGYDEIQTLFQKHLKPDRKVYNEYHALIVGIGKEFCKKKARCSSCPLDSLNLHPATRFTGDRTSS